MPKFTVQDIVVPKKKVTIPAPIVPMRPKTAEHIAPERRAEAPKDNVTAWPSTVGENIPREIRHTNTVERVSVAGDMRETNEHVEPIDNSDNIARSKIPTLEYRPHHVLPKTDHQIHPEKVRTAKPLYITAGIIAAFAIVALVSPLFSGATITISPKKQIIAVDQQITATKTPEGNHLGYSVIEIPISAQKELTATGNRSVTAKATGKIEIYNAFGIQSQRLIKNTRFQGSNGLIYRINESINIPGTTSVGGKVGPGHIEATIFADEPGVKFNSAPMDFTVPGLKGDPRFDKIYARAKNEITGGASGQIRTVSDADMASAKLALASELQGEVGTKVKENLYAGQIVYDGGISSTQSEPIVKEGAVGSDTVTLIQEGKISAIVFDQTSLTHELATKLDETYSGDGVSIANLSNLVFSMSESDKANLPNTSSVIFSLKGDADVRYLVDKAGISHTLAGTAKSDFNQNLQKIPGIEKANATITPFWQRYFPKNPEKITITITSGDKQ